MKVLKSLKILFCIMAILLVAKPLVAFNMYKRVLTPSNQSSRFLLLKLIKKRKEGEYVEDMVAEISSVQQNLTAPAIKLLLRFAVFTTLLFESFLALTAALANGFCSRFLRMVSAGWYFLFLGKLSI